jgi:hypothetical protein
MDISGIVARLTYRGRSSIISGIVGGKVLHWAMRLSQAGTNLPSGEYHILPPQNDLIYGTIALVVPAEKWEAPGGRIAIKHAARSPTVGTEAAFVLSDRPIRGRNSVIVQSGFADLMDALKVSGGATLQVL